MVENNFGEIIPSKTTILECLSNKSYKVDFYQREYVWSEKTVKILLDDIFYSFEQSYTIHKDCSGQAFL